MKSQIRLQENDYYCGPAAAQMSLLSQGIDVSQKQIAKLAGTNSALGTTGEGLVEAAQKLGCDAFMKDNSSIADIRTCIHRNIHPIVAWLDVDVPHFTVAAKIDRTNITMLDPLRKTPRVINIKDFRRLWLDFDVDYMETKDDLILRRMIVIHKGTRRSFEAIQRKLCKE